MAKNNVRKTKQFKALRAQAQEAIVAYMDGLDIDEAVKRLAPVGAKMKELLAYRGCTIWRGITQPPSRTAADLFALRRFPWRGVFYRRPSAPFCLGSGGGFWTPESIMP